MTELKKARLLGIGFDYAMRNPYDNPFPKQKSSDGTQAEEEEAKVESDDEESEDVESDDEVSEDGDFDAVLTHADAPMDTSEFDFNHQGYPQGSI
jgi:hypothetical protein